MSCLFIDALACACFVSISGELGVAFSFFVLNFQLLFHSIKIIGEIKYILLYKKKFSDVLDDATSTFF